MRKYNSLKIPAAIVVSTLFFAGSANAHHSHASLNMDDVRLYKGRVTKYSWTMPHVFLRIEAPDASGNIVEYTVEMQHPPAMARVG